MHRHILAFLPALLALACFEAALAIVAPLISLRLSERGVAATTIGLIASAYSLGYLGGTQLCRPILARFGLAAGLTGFAVIAAAAVAAHIFSADLSLWFGLSIICGLVMAGLYLAIEKTLNAIAGRETRGRLYGAYMMVSWGAAAFAPLLLMLDRPGGWFLFALAAATLLIGALPARALKQRPDLAAFSRAPNARWRIFRTAPKPALAICFISGVESGALHGLLPNFALAAGYSAAQLSLLLSLMMLAGLASQWPMAHLSDRAPNRGSLATASLIAAAAFALPLALAPGLSFLGVLGLIVLLSAALAPLYALGAALANDWSASEAAPSPVAALLLVNGIGAAAGPLLAGLAMDRLGPGGLFGCIAVAALAPALLLYRAERGVEMPKAMPCASGSRSE